MALAPTPSASQLSSHHLYHLTYMNLEPPTLHLDLGAWNRLFYIPPLTVTSAKGPDHLDDDLEALAGQVDDGSILPAADQQAGTIIAEAVIVRP